MLRFIFELLFGKRKVKLESDKMIKDTKKLSDKLKEEIIKNYVKKD
jgi:hypothetical protein